MYVLVKPGTSLKSRTAPAQPADSLNPYSLSRSSLPTLPEPRCTGSKARGKVGCWRVRFSTPDDSIEEINHMLAANPHSQQLLHRARLAHPREGDGRRCRRRGQAALRTSSPRFRRSRADRPQCARRLPPPAPPRAITLTTSMARSPISPWRFNSSASRPTPPDMEDALVGRGRIYSAAGTVQREREWLERAVTDFNQALAISPNTPRHMICVRRR